MKKTIFALELGLIMMFTSLNGLTQSRLDFYEFADQWNIGARLSAVNFYGDLPESDITFAPGFFLTKMLTPEIGIGFSTNFGSMSGKRKFSDRKFEASYFDYTLDLSLDFLKMISGNPDNPVSITGIVGVGHLNFRTKKFNLAGDQLIKYYGYSDGGETKSAMVNTLAIPYGLGIGYMINNDVGVDLSFKMFKISTDKLDGRDRAERSENDTYSNVSLSFKYKLPLKSSPSFEE